MINKLQAENLDAQMELEKLQLEETKVERDSIES